MGSIEDEGITKVALETELGKIVMAVFVDKAPSTAAYFLSFVDSGAYNGAVFYRSTKLANPHGPRLVQGGLLYEIISEGATEVSQPSRDIMLESVETTAQTGLQHTFATVSLARDIYNTGLVLPEIFICLGDFPELDVNGRSQPDTQGFPAFAKVIEGMDIVELIAEKKTSGKTSISALNGQILTKPIVIIKAYRM